jgi:hypothetical protein
VASPYELLNRLVRVVRPGDSRLGRSGVAVTFRRSEGRLRVWFGDGEEDGLYKADELELIPAEEAVRLLATRRKESTDAT